MVRSTECQHATEPSNSETIPTVSTTISNTLSAITTILKTLKTTIINPLFFLFNFSNVENEISLKTSIQAYS